MCVFGDSEPEDKKELTKEPETRMNWQLFFFLLKVVGPTVGTGGGIPTAQQRTANYTVDIDAAPRVDYTV